MGQSNRLGRETPHLNARFNARSVLRRLTVAFLSIFTLLSLCGCGGVSLRRLGISVAVQGSFTQVYASSAPITLTATLDDDPTGQGVVWNLSLANSSCSPDCGKLTTSSKFSAVYTPPPNLPRNATATITAMSVADNGAAFVFNFTILAPISVSVTNKFATQKSGDPSVGLNATVSNDLSNAGVTWTLTVGGKSCPPEACGTLTAPPAPTLTATYTPPVTAPTGDNASPTITATSVTDPTKNDSFTFAIVPGITVTITNKFQQQFFGDPPVVVNASVDADSANAGVTWTLVNANGQACSNCGTLVAAPSPSFSATYTPPTTQPLGADSNPTITATSVTNPTKSDRFSFKISVSTRPFAGQYAFLLRGFNDLTSVGKPNPPMAMAGSVTLDAQGNVTGGDLDINNSGGITSVTGLVGNFSPESSFNGIIRGTINLTNVVFAGTSTPFPLSFKFVLSSDYMRGRIEELDGALFVNAGTIQRQDPAALTAANPAGAYAFGVDSDAPLGGRTVEAGQVILASNAVTGGLVDESKAGDPTPRYSATPLATSSLQAPNSNGRGTLTLSVASNGSVPGSPDQYAYYIVNSGQINLIQIDAAPTFGTVFAGVARAQKPLTPTSVNATSVLQLTGMDAVPGTTNQVGPDVIIGVVTIPNGTGQTFTLTFDENDLGNIFSSKTTAGAITFNPATGRGTLAEPGSGFGIGFMDLAVFYLSDAGQGFVIDADISTCVPVTVCPGGQPPNNYPITNNAFSGTLTPQATGVQFDNNSLQGNVIFSSGATAISNIPSLLAGMNFIFNSTAIPPTTYTAKGDLSSLGSQDGNLPDVSFNGTYSVFGALPGTPPGHGLLRLPEQIFGVFPGANQLDSAFFYLIGPNQGVAIGVQQGSGTQPGPYSGVMFFDPQ